ncbi:MAG: M20 family metallopeptidase [Paeniglutamicibacter sp.]
MNPLLRAAQSHHDTMIGQIKDLVAVETYSSDLQGLAAGLDHVRELATAVLGEPAESILTPGGDHGDILQLTYPGTGGGKVLVIGHYDTVWPTGTFGDWGIIEGTDAQGRATLSAPGIFDMKTGLVQGFWALKLVRDAGLPHPEVTFLFNGDEEIGSLASRPVIEAAALEADAVLVLEPTSGQAVKTGRKGVGIFEVKATGIEAHAGLDPKSGANAIHGLAEFITAASQVADLDKGTSISTGLVSGGSASNVAAGTATAVIDIRVESQAEMARVDAALDAITVSDERVRIEIDHYWNRPPMDMTEPGQRLFDVVSAAAVELGHALENTSVGGGSDANFVSALGVPVLCGMGAVGDGAHARHEFIYPDEIPLFTAITANSLVKLANGWMAIAA